MEKCPVGYLCFNREIFIIIAIFIIGLAVYGFNNNKANLNFPQKPSEATLKIQLLEEQLKTQNYRIQNENNKLQKQSDQQINIITPPIENLSSHQQELVRITDPLAGPERQYPYVLSKTSMPINVPTRGYITEYQQVGALYGIGQGLQTTKILPLYGKPTYPGSNKWVYYTGTDNYQSVKIPIFKEGRKCQGDFGCEELYSDDLVNISPYNCKFKVELYDIERPRYLPNVF